MNASLSARFDQFIDLRTNRFEALRALLTEQGLEPAVVELSGGRHLFVAPSRDLPRSAAPTVLIAHYDRVPVSPGANDNAAGVFQLLQCAGRLRSERQGGWLVVFTDKEEAAGVNGVKGQGAFALARALRDIGLADARLFIFDACGRGNTIVISTALDHLLRDQGGAGIEKARHDLAALRDRTLGAARRIRAERVLLAPTPFSDDAGLLAGGLCAQTITVLPDAEAATLANALRRQPDLAAGLVNRDARGGASAPFFPATWKLLNTPGDGRATLTEGINPLMVRLAHALCVPE